ncbi:MAG TPA: isocitrate/isopropylmalate family dehydrogenase [Pirellulales bacterium]|jgi:tartrate dehydrogenase/decarboxylase/D-malate dehydrogenase|nr:isocitrate/isopropylmalate family dehydrogenase [Pirellulales bacterium]
MQTFRIAVYPGDGIGPEVIAEAVRVLEAVESTQDAFHLELTELPWGCAFYHRTGNVAPDDFLQVLRPFDAILLGAVGWPAELPDHVTLDPLVRIRQAFDQYACVRPARLLPGVPCVLANKGPRDVDLVVIRENSEGEYVNIGGRFHVGHPDESAVQTAVHTRRGVERILRFGFRMALERRRRLTMITKSNAQRFAYLLWDELLEGLRREYPSVEVDKQHADAAVMNFVRCPERFDVVVASNLFGDILTDLGGLISGGLGLAPSSNLCPERTAPSMFEPVHGSAPDIAGKGTANPIAAVLSAAMMLDWLGQPRAAGEIRVAVERVLSAGHTTPDLGGRLSTSQLGDRLVEAVGSKG